MEKRYRKFKIFLVIFVVLTLLHTSFHILSLGTGIQGFAESGISGFAIGQSDVGEESPGFSFGSIISTIMVFGEWITVVLFLIFLYTHNKILEGRELVDLTLQIKHNKKSSPTETEIDRLYELLKQKKRIKISTISKAFKVDKNTILEWSKILESGNLAEIEYPHFGSPSVKLKKS